MREGKEKLTGELQKWLPNNNNKFYRPIAAQKRLS